MLWFERRQINRCFAMYRVFRFSRPRDRNASDVERTLSARGISACRTLVVAITSALLVASCATTPNPVTVSEVVAMSKEGTDASVIIARMRETRSVYRLPGSAFGDLKDQGVPGPVLDYMLQTYLRAERERQVEDCSLGPPYFVIE